MRNSTKSENGTEKGLELTEALSRPFWRRHRWMMWAGGASLLALCAVAVVISIGLHHVEPFLRARIVAELQQHFHSRVELDSFHMALWKGLSAEGKGLRIWPPQEPGNSGAGAPLIQLKEFRFHAPLHYIPSMPFHISEVELKGLDVNIPPKGNGHQKNAAPLAPGKAKSAAALVELSVGTLVCTGARLTIETSQQGKAPLVFVISHLKLTHVTGGGAMGFEAELTNPRPVGTIHTKGSFGPWTVDDPGESPINGNYRFQHADLATFKGIAGILSSTGRYNGTLRDITVDGETNTPDFRLTSGGSGMNLHTRFHAQVDGTNGNTWLQPVDATLGRSHFTARGQIVRLAAQSAQYGQPAHPGGHDIALTVDVDNGRIEDFLRLASSGQPLLNGALTMKTSFEIPPGSTPVTNRLQLNGKFQLNDVQFTSANMQKRIRQLSMRGQGNPDDAKGGSTEQVRSAMHGDFQMAGGVVKLPKLTYSVPGAEIDLKGSYGVNDGALDFKGAAKMEATISQMVGGWKGLLLTPLDPFFKKDGAGTEVPVAIHGTRKNPQFTVDFGALKKTVPARPGGKS